MRLKTAELEGDALDYMVWLAERGEKPIPGLSVASWAADYGGDFFPSTDWQQGGQLIEKYLVSLSQRGRHILGQWAGKTVNKERTDLVEMCADAPLVALCRTVVASVFGDEVEVPV